MLENNKHIMLRQIPAPVCRSTRYPLIHIGKHLQKLLSYVSNPKLQYQKQGKQAYCVAYLLTLGNLPFLSGIIQFFSVAGSVFSPPGPSLAKTADYIAKSHHALHKSDGYFLDFIKDKARRS